MINLDIRPQHLHRDGLDPDKGEVVGTPSPKWKWRNVLVTTDGKMYRGHRTYDSAAEAKAMNAMYVSNNPNKKFWDTLDGIVYKYDVVFTQQLPVSP